MSKTRVEIQTPTGEGIVCTCMNVPAGQKPFTPHHHGEFHHLLPRFRSGKVHTEFSPKKPAVVKAAREAMGLA